MIQIMLPRTAGRLRPHQEEKKMKSFLVLLGVAILSSYVNAAVVEGENLLTHG